MPRAFQLLLCLALAGTIAWTAGRTPAPRPEGAGHFSAVAAMADVRAIAARPHPIGSPEHARVRDYVAGRLRGLGLRTQVWTDEAMQVSAAPTGAYVSGGRIQDVIGVLPGRSPAAPAVLVMAHYDTVPGSPGAADDSAGVAVALQVAGRLQARGPPERDVVFLITDGEEAGLLGARAFFARHPLARRVGAVLNLESRGGGGRVYMFETGPGNGGMIALFARAVRNPTANSLSGFVYDRMPNDTDFSLAKAKGLPGLNFAFIGRPFDYHAPSATPANLDQGSLQHMGDQVLAAAAALAFSPRLPRPAPDVVYADLLGGPIVRYPPWGGWVVLALAAALGGAVLRPRLRAEGLQGRDALRGAAAPLLSAVAAGALATGARALTGAGPGFAELGPLLARFGLYEAVLAILALAAALAVFALLSAGRPRFWSAFAGAFLTLLLLAVGLQLAAPVAAHVLAWPVLATAVLALLAGRGREGRPRGLVWAVLAAPPLAWLMYLAHAVALGVGTGIPAAPAALAPMATLLLFPLLSAASPGRARAQLWTAALVLAAGAALVAAIRLQDPFSPRHPRPTDIRYVVDRQEPDRPPRFLRTSALGRDQAWIRAALTADGGRGLHVEPGEVSPLLEASVIAPARPVTVAGPQVRAARSSDGRLRLEITPSAPDAALRVQIDAKALRAAQANGRPIRLQAGARRLEVSWSDPAGLALTLESSGPVHVRYAETRPSWPAEARPLPPRPPGLAPWGRSDSTVVLGGLTAP